MIQNETTILNSLWGKFFHNEKFIQQDRKIGAINLFQEFFLSEEGRTQTGNINHSLDKNVYFDVQKLNETLPFPDFETTLTARPIEVIGCVGMALSLIVNKQNPYSSEITMIRCKFYNLRSTMPFGDLKSSSVGQLVKLEGHVVKASACHPLVESAAFLCSKCRQATWIEFEDGVYMPPDVCATPK